MKSPLAILELKVDKIGKEKSTGNHFIIKLKFRIQIFKALKCIILAD